MKIAKEVTRRIIISHLKNVKVVRTTKTSYDLYTSKIKEGGNGFVFYGQDKSSGDRVALKFYFPNNPKWQLNDSNYNRFLNEIALLKKADHARLIKCLDDDVIEVEGKRVPYYVMPRAKGSMRDLLNKDQFKKNLEFAYRFFKELGLALQYLHENGCFHRDLKPENVLLDKNNLPLVADVGIAHINPEFVAATVHTGPKDKLHNLSYYAPEQRYSGDATKVDHRADICSFGYLLQEALTGRYPLGSNAALPGSIKPEYVVFDAAIMKCTRDERQIHNRYQSMVDCLKALDTTFKGSNSEKKQLVAFYIACQKVQRLACQWPMSAELLSARTLRTLYLKRSEYIPSESEKVVLFANLLLGGAGRTHDQRTDRADSATAYEAPMPLGWYWFTDLNKEECLSLVRQAISYPNVFVSAGALRAIGRLGNNDDRSLLIEKLNHTNPRPVSESIRGLGRLGTEEDIDRIRELHSDRRAEVRGSVAHVLAQRGSSSDIEIISNLLKDENTMVRSAAVKALSRRAPLEEAKHRLQIIIEDPNEVGQVLSVAKEEMKRLNNISYEPTEHSHDRFVKKMQKEYGLEDSYDEIRGNKAWDLVLTSKHFGIWDAALRWIVSYEPRTTIEDKITRLGAKLRLSVLRHFDYRLYCPSWWRDEMYKLTN